MITLSQLDEIEARVNAATPGPWEYARLGNADGSPSEGKQILDQLKSMVYKTVRRGDSQRHAYMTVAGTLPRVGDKDPEDFCMTSFSGNGPTSHINANFIAAARTDVPALCVTLRRAIELLQHSVRLYDDSFLVNGCGDFEGRAAMEDNRDFLDEVTKEPMK